MVDVQREAHADERDDGEPACDPAMLAQMDELLAMQVGHLPYAGTAGTRQRGTLCVTPGTPTCFSMHQRWVKD